MTDAERPNVLLVVTDDQRYDTIRALGNDAIRTPCLDRLVADGCAFTRAHNMGSQHGAVCAPARRMLHGGRSLFHLHGPSEFTDEHALLPEAFGDAGYRTFGTGKWHNGREAFNRCFDEGEGTYFGGASNHWNLSVTDRHPLGEYPDEQPHGDLRKSSGVHSSELFADTMVDFLRRHALSDDDRPFFAYAALMAPHYPKTAPGAFHALYDPEDIELPPNFLEQHPFDNRHLPDADRLDPDEVRADIADYYAMISHLDYHVGRMVDTLERVGERENTIVVFTADHGLALGRHGLMKKQNVYDHTVRVPLLFSGPGIPAGERRGAFTYHHDLYPTLADFAGIEIPDTVDGESQAPVITDDAPPPRDRAFSAWGNTNHEQFDGHMRAVRTDRFKLIDTVVGDTSRVRLFDVENDPHQTENLADDPAYADDVERLHAQLVAWRERQGDPMLPAPSTAG